MFWKWKLWKWMWRREKYKSSLEGELYVGIEWDWPLMCGGFL